MVERAVLMARGRVLMPSHFPGTQGQAGSDGTSRASEEFVRLPFHKAVAALEKRMIENALREAGGNKTEAANRLQINRRLLYNKMVEHKIEE